MEFVPTRIQGVFIVELEPFRDDRGFFARSYSAGAYKEIGVEAPIAETSVSLNKKKGTLRGMHYQIKPFEETKMVRVTRGSIFDVAVDLRPSSPTYLGWVSVELSASNQRKIVIPRGCAHGFQTLSDDCELYYEMTNVFSPDHYRGVRWNDPAFNIAWPVGNPILSRRDREFALLADRADLPASPVKPG